MYHFQVIFINENGETVTREVEARHEFEAKQLAGALGRVIISIVNCDL